MKKAFTLIEMMVSVALFALLFGIVFEILFSGNVFWEAGSAQGDLQVQARQAFERLTKELYNSNQYRFYPAPNNATWICFQLPVGYDSFGNLQWGAAGVPGRTIKIFISNGNLVRWVYTGTTGNAEPTPNDHTTLASYVDDIKFTAAGSALTISMRMKKTTPLGKTYIYGTADKPITTSITFRN